MTQYARAFTPLMWGVLAFAGLLALLGVALIALGSGGSSEFVLFGQSFKSANVGVSALFISAVVGVLLGRRIIAAIERTTDIAVKGILESVLHRYERLREGLALPEQNVSVIEEIANSADPHKEKYLSEIISASSYSFLERASAKLALDALQSGQGSISGLFAKVTEEEKSRLKAGLGIGDDSTDAQFWYVVFGLKYWRYINRPNHPQFAEVQNQLASAMMGKVNLKGLTAIGDELDP